MKQSCIFAILLGLFASGCFCYQAVAAPDTGPSDIIRSHRIMRSLPRLTKRPMAEGSAYFVSSKMGHDDHPGSIKKPWATINHAMTQLKSGDTLYLREGVYFENAYCAVAGTKDKPITIRTYPGERVNLDGGMAEFRLNPVEAWQLFKGGAKDEYVSTRTFRNIRDVVGIVGDSHVGLQTYWHPKDLRAANEMWITDKKTKSIQPVYCGPGRCVAGGFRGPATPKRQRFTGYRCAASKSVDV